MAELERMEAAEAAREAAGAAGKAAGEVAGEAAGEVAGEAAWEFAEEFVKGAPATEAAGVAGIAGIAGAAEAVAEEAGIGLEARAQYVHSYLCITPIDGWHRTGCGWAVFGA